MVATGVITAIRTFLCDTGHGRNFLFVVVETDVGLAGVGEGSQSDQDVAVVANIRDLTPRYMGRSPLDLVEATGSMLMSNRTGRAIFVAVSAIEQALWDVAGKLLNAPVYQLLGGSPYKSMRCYATLVAGLDDTTPEGLAREAERCLNLGFTALKIAPFPGLRSTIFDSGDGRMLFATGLERVAAVRAVLGPDADLLIECDFSFDRATATRVARAIEPYECFWLEAPLRWDDPVELAHLRHAIHMRLASGETLHGRRAYREMIERQAVDVLQPDVKWTGGIFEAKKIAAWAETYQMACAPHNNSGPVATAASAHLAATLPNFLLLETASRPPAWETDLIGDSGVIRGGRVEIELLRTRPGLGIDFDQAAARRWEVHA